MKITSYTDHAAKHPEAFDKYVSEYAGKTLNQVSEERARAKATFDHQMMNARNYNEFQLTHCPLRYWAATVVLRKMYEQNGWDTNCL